MPDELSPFHLASQQERRRRIRRALVAGYVRWRKGGISMVAAVREESSCGAAAEYALRELRMFLHQLDLTSWETHPNRLRAEISSVFKRTIGRVSVHRGGWRVHHTRTHG